MRRLPYSRTDSLSLALAIALALALVLALARSAQGQSGVGLILHGGALMPTGDTGPAATAAGPWYLHLEQRDPAPVFGASLVLPFATGFDARLTAFGSLTSAAHGFFDCYDGLACPAILIEDDVDVRTLAALAEITWAPLASLVSPYLLAGAGVRHDRYDWDGATELVGSLDESDAALVVRAGVGLAVPVGPIRLHLEIAQAWSPGSSLDAPAAPAMAPRRHALNDLTLTAGIRVF